MPTGAGKSSTSLRRLCRCLVLRYVTTLTHRCDATLKNFYLMVMYKNILSYVVHALVPTNYHGSLWVFVHILIRK